MLHTWHRAGTQGVAFFIIDDDHCVCASLLLVNLLDVPWLHICSVLACSLTDAHVIASKHVPTRCKAESNSLDPSRFKLVLGKVVGPCAADSTELVQALAYHMQRKSEP